jgi:hypothetical protein
LLSIQIARMAALGKIMVAIEASVTSRVTKETTMKMPTVLSSAIISKGIEVNAV